MADVGVDRTNCSFRSSASTYGTGRSTRGAGKWKTRGKTPPLVLKIHSGALAGDAYSERQVGAEFVSSDVNISLEVAGKTVALLGTCEKVIISKHDTTFINADSKEEVLKNRVAELESHLAVADNDYDREFLKERIAKLIGKIAVIRVGGSSEAEVEEKKARIDDALGAARC